MEQVTSNSPLTLQERFPKMRPVNKPPSLYTMNGFGAGVYGNRDADIETGTYVKTYCLCALFIPVIALGAYRVANAEGGGWYFIGKEPLSRFAKAWNWIVLCLLILTGTGIGVSSYRSGLEYAAKQDLKRAAVQAQAGQHLQAAMTYRRLLDGHHFLNEARQGFKSTVEPCLDSNSPDLIARALTLIGRLPASPVQDAFKRGMVSVEKFRGSDPEGALTIAQALRVVNPNAKEIAPLEIDLLKAIVAKDPNNTTRAVELAVIYEDAKQLEESVKLLKPHQEKLSNTEGARILGQHLLQEGENEAAYGLLYPYVQTRLATLRRVEHAYTNAAASASQRAVEALNRNQAPSSWYTSYKAASEAERERMVDAFVQEWMERDPGYKRATAELATANKIVPVTLDLGIVQVNRAQNLQDTSARKAELEAAEKTFLAIRGLAGETDEYRLFLGQVYYWLGKAVEGKKLYDGLLAKHKRAFPILMALASKLRLVGENVQSRELSEEAYRTAKEPKQRYEAATFRALLMKDSDDRIAWLGKADPNDTDIQIELSGARGIKALEDQDLNAAARHLRQAIAGYQKLTKNSTTLNNCALAHLSLYRATGDLNDHQRGVSLLEEALALDQGDSVLLINTMNVMLRHALAEVVGDRIRLGPLGEPANFSTLGFLYNTEQERNDVYARLRENPSFKKALSYMDRVLLLAPKRLESYHTALQIYAGIRDLPELQKLQQRFVTASPDFREEEEEYAELYKGTRDKESRDRTQRALDRFQSLLQSPAFQGHQATLNYIKMQVSYYQQALWAYGVETDANKLVQNATELYQAHTSSATRGNLIAAHLFRAVDQLRRQNTELDAFVKKHRRTLATQYMVAWLAERGGTLGSQLQGHPDIAKALALAKESVEKFPSFQSPDDWALLRSTDASFAASIAAKYKDNTISQMIDELQYRFFPLGMTHILENYWKLKLLGDDQKAAAAHQDALKKGVPLPSI